MNGRPLPSWGLHGGDINLAQGNLVKIVAAQASGYARAGSNP